jgi:hypothetical protein
MTVFPYSMQGERERLWGSAHLKQVRVGIQGSKKWMKGVLKKNVSFFFRSCKGNLKNVSTVVFVLEWNENPKYTTTSKHLFHEWLRKCHLKTQCKENRRGIWLTEGFRAQIFWTHRLKLSQRLGTGTCECGDTLFIRDALLCHRLGRC